jgi:transmembrane sensor
MSSDFTLHAPPGDDAFDAARDWVLRLDENPALAPQCDAWRARSRDNDAAYREVRRVFDAASGLEGLVDPAWRTEADALGRTPMGRIQNWTRRGPGRIVVPLAMAASVAMAVLLPGLLGGHGQPVETGVAETRLLALADGSRVTLGARSGMDVSFDGVRREVTMKRGQAFFEVEHDAARPFTVIAGDAEIRVTGTKFDVHWIGDTVAVSVLEGRVELRKRRLIPIGSTQAERVLTAGTGADLAEGEAFSAVSPMTVTPGEWRRGRLFYSETSLSEIVADVQRYSATPIRIAQPSVGGLKVTTSFRADNVDQFVSNIEASLPVAATRAADGSITFSTK